jgi:hypothetical protein
VGRVSTDVQAVAVKEKKIVQIAMVMGLLITVTEEKNAKLVQVEGIRDAVIVEME